MNDRIQILVINEYSFSAATISDAALAHGYKKNEVIASVHDFIHSVRYNNMQSLKSQCAARINFSYSDLCGHGFSLVCENETIEFHTSLDDEKQQILKHCSFYSPQGQTVLDADFICQNFDALLLVFDQPLDGTRLADAVLSLLMLDKCPPFFIGSLRFHDLRLVETLALLDIAKNQTLTLFPDGVEPKTMTVAHERLSLFLYSVLARSKRALIDKEQCSLLEKTSDLWAQQAERPVLQALNIPFAYTVHTKDVMQTMVKSFLATKGLLLLSETEQERDENSLQPQSKKLTMHVPKVVNEDVASIHTVALASRYMLYDHNMLLDYRGFCLICETKVRFPQAKLIVVLNDTFYSHLNELSSEVVLFEKELQCGEKRQESTVHTPGQLSSAFVAKLNTIVFHQLKSYVAHHKEHKSLVALFSSLEQQRTTGSLKGLIDQCYVCVELDDINQQPFDILITDQSELKVVALQQGRPLLELPDCERFLVFKDEQRRQEWSFGSPCLEEMDAGFFRSFIESIAAEQEEMSALEKEQTLCSFQADQLLENPLYLFAENALQSLARSEQYKKQNHVDPQLCPLHTGSWPDVLQRLHNLHKATLNVRQSFLEFIKQVQDQKQRQLGLQTQQYSNFTLSARYNDLWELIHFYTAALHPEKTTVTTLGELLCPPLVLTKQGLIKQPCFQQQSLKILSFGCSRGDEIFDLAQIFKGQDFTGVDISEQALAQARLLAESTDFAAMGSQVRFINSKTFVEEDEQYDVVVAMTVLCRHPTASRLTCATGVYDFAEFAETVKLLDKHVKPGGILCIFNANYRFTETSTAAQYKQIAPIEIPSIAIEAKETDDIADYSQCLCSSLPQAQYPLVNRNAVVLPEDKGMEGMIGEIAVSLSGLHQQPHVRVFEKDGHFMPIKVQERVGYLFYKSEGSRP